MNKKIYDSEETLRAGLKAEQETIIEYTQYLNMAKQNKNEAEVRLWEHIIKDEQEHVKEFENALKGNFNLLDKNTIIDFKKNKENCEMTYNLLKDSSLKVNIFEINDSYYLQILGE